MIKKIHLILVDKQLDLFIKNNLGYEDLKLFGKMQEAENLKNDYQARAVTQVLTGGSLNMQWTSIN